MPKDNSTWMIENALAGYTDTATNRSMQMQIFRTRTGVALQSWSADGGYNWTFPTNMTLPNPNSRVCAPALTSAASLFVLADSGSALSHTLVDGVAGAMTCRGKLHHGNECSSSNTGKGHPFAHLHAVHMMQSTSNCS